MLAREEIEQYLDKLDGTGATYQEVEPGLWIVKPGGALDLGVVVHYAPPLVSLRLKVMELPTDPAQRATLTQRLLELNASDLVHGAYGIEGQAIVLTEALELNHLDYEEFRASYEGITLALASHLRELGSFSEAH